MTAIITRAGKGSPLTNTEMDTNLTNLNSYKVEQDISGNATITGDVYLTGSGKRITGDFSNATIANRVLFQTSTVNDITNVGAIPNGTATLTQFTCFGGADPTNTSTAMMLNTGSEVSYRSDITGTGNYLPMTFYTGGLERMRIDTSGNVLVDGNNLNLFSAKSLAANGYQKLPSGLIIQWGQIATSAAGSTSFTWPIAFPNAVYSGVITGQVPGGSIYVSSIHSMTTSGFDASTRANNGAFVAEVCTYIAIGH